MSPCLVRGVYVVVLRLRQALAALNEYHSAVSETSVMIRNKPAYLMGILRKYKQGQRIPIGNGSSSGTAGGMPAKTTGRMGVSVTTMAPGRSSMCWKVMFFSSW